MRLLPPILVVAILIAACGSRAQSDTAADTGTGPARSTEATPPSDDVDESTGTSEVETPTTTTVSTATTPSGPGATSSTTAVPTPTTRPPHTYTPPAGTYHYDVVGTTQNSGLLSGRERPLPESSTDTVVVTPTATGQRVTTRTRDGGESSQLDLAVEVTSEYAQLVELSQRGDNGPVIIAIAPEPPALLARLPYRVGGEWEIAWSDDASGVSGVGTGTVLRDEAITTPAGQFDTVVIEVNQRLRGTISGMLELTAWIDRATGVQAKQHLVTEFNNATGSSRTDATRTLRAGPA